MQFSQVRSISAMVRRPIIWGVIFAIIGAVGWVFSVVLAVLTLGAFKILALFFGILFVASLSIYPKPAGSRNLGVNHMDKR